MDSRKVQDKWEGEDEEDVKDNWDDEEDEQPTSVTPDPNMVATAAPKNKAKKKQKILEKEAAGRIKEVKSPEEMAAEKLRLEKQQEQAVIRGIQEAFGATDLNTADPETKDDFDEIRKRLVGDLGRFENRPVFGDFLEDLIQDFCLYLPARRLKKVKTSVEALYFEKTKAEKAATKAPAGKSSGSKQKINLNVEGDRAVLSNYGDDMGAEIDDFM